MRGREISNRRIEKVQIRALRFGFETDAMKDRVAVVAKLKRVFKVLAEQTRDERISRARWLFGLHDYIASVVCSRCTERREYAPHRSAAKLETFTEEKHHAANPDKMRRVCEHAPEQNPRVFRTGPVETEASAECCERRCDAIVRPGVRILFLKLRVPLHEITKLGLSRFCGVEGRKLSKLEYVTHGAIYTSSILHRALARRASSEEDRDLGPLSYKLESTIVTRRKHKD